ncbi:ABC transporter ATP-binding protein [Candidatus Woesearchaeota archaeon]|nr:ABC transporter ATP-binding protein [Candidatus Woesearchaeota archaeon]
MTQAIAELIGNSFHRGETQILEGIDWTIRGGEHWALIGPNGSGKTTLLKILSGTEWPSSGKVKVLGKSFGKTDLRELRKHIGLVSSYLAEKVPEQDSVQDIIISGKHASFGNYEGITRADRAHALELLEFLGCAYLQDRAFAVLSQGERQKVLIARALMAKPALLILDEPCTGLDMKARENVLRSVSRICTEKKATVVYVTHHIEEIVGEITHVLMLREGRMFFRGKRRDALTTENITALFG